MAGLDTGGEKALSREMLNLGCFFFFFFGGRLILSIKSFFNKGQISTNILQSELALGLKGNLGIVKPVVQREHLGVRAEMYKEIRFRVNLICADLKPLDARPHCLQHMFLPSHFPSDSESPEDFSWGYIRLYCLHVRRKL